MSWHPWIGWTLFTILFVVPPLFILGRLAVELWRKSRVPGVWCRVGRGHYWVPSLGPAVSGCLIAQLRCARCGGTRDASIWPSRWAER